eukprot:5738323-Prymnesium_polylepis.1
MQKVGVCPTALGLAAMRLAHGGSTGRGYPTYGQYADTREPTGGGNPANGLNPSTGRGVRTPKTLSPPRGGHGQHAHAPRPALALPRGRTGRPPARPGA